jgi:PAS domain S-box-containing protein
MPDVPDSSEHTTPLALAPELLPQLLALSPDALLVVDQAGIITHLNHEAEKLFGSQATDLLGRPLEILMPARFHARHIARREAYAAAPHTRPMEAHLDLSARRSDGTEIPVDISLRPVFIEGQLHVIAAIRDLTARRAAERERLLQTERLRAQAGLLDLSHEAILMRDPIHRILSWSRGAERLYGWTAQEALGHISHTLLQTRFPTNRPAIEAQLERDGQWEGELVHIRRDGSTLQVRSHQMLLRDEQQHITAILELNHPISEQDQTQESTPTSHADSTDQAAHLAFFRQVLDALPSGIHLVRGTDARLVLANRASADIWGARWQPGQPMQAFLETQGIRLVDAQGRTLAPDTWVTLRAVRQREIARSYQEHIVRPGGMHLPVLVYALPVTPQTAWQDDGTILDTSEPFALVLYQDVTSLKEVERLKDEFIGIAAHELRAPLAVLKSAASMLRVQTARGHGPQLADWQQETLQDIEQATDRLSNLTEDLLDVTRLQAGKLTLHPCQTEMVALVRHVVAALQQTTTRHQLIVSSALEAREMMVDRERIEQVLVNLIGNAIKYSPQGGEITIHLWENTDEGLEISIQDKGIGIPVYQQRQVFGRFMRADNAHALSIQGTGLGLYLCRELIEQHGGRIWFQSTEGKGSTFFFTLPHSH